MKTGEFNLKRMVRGWTAVAASALLISCASAPQEPQSNKFQLTLLHINDHHSTLAPKQQTLVWGDQEWQVEAGGFPRVAAQLKALRKANNNVLTLHAGDALTGSLYFTLFGSEADARMMNNVCFDAFTIGNHEFDNGDAGLVKFLQQLGTERCPTAKLGANIKPKVGDSPLTPNRDWEMFKPYTVVERNGEEIAIIGLDIASKTKKSSQPDETTEFLDELETARKYVAEVQQQGIEKIVLLTHIQYERDKELVQQLPGVDIVIGGDSHTLLGDFSGFGMESDGPYPTELTNADGDKVCLAHAYQYSLVVGEMQAFFDGDKIEECGGRPHYLLSNDIQVSDGIVTTYEPIKTALEESGVFSFVEPDAELQNMLEDYQSKVEDFSAEVLAQVPQQICSQEIDLPRRDGCADVMSSGAHRLVAEAFLHSVPEADFAIQNGGGVRSDISEGDFTVGDAFNVLPFANTLVKLELSGSEFKQAMEEALAYSVSDGGSTRAYPYGAGIRYSVDLTKEKGSRVSNLQVWDKGSNSWQPMMARATYVMVTNSFIAGGQDGYDTFYRVSERGRARNTGIDYAESLVNYARTQDVLKRPEDFATQSYVPAGDN
ncbi:MULTISPECIES: 5'-nucleotidase C-terminal domain-containing protein [Idiomarina]|mgnify:FL=1|uniref:bifunctional metallophosphatase/5'-nucleotidase n=1 Tax=Idiomarina TaxID=135575 RepID=UPI0006C87AE9|nr:MULTISPECIES: 5'-nucleotidase C-terminal domain-containing protein [Idiomarina]KPD22910.1 5'-nucleotidase [Idiomarina abyssalis]MAO69242.1 bifunctional metallophosphatase/5'-nucleotidase [Idiomarina sp.]MBF80684.1 bifunctional metallophosphatase/5'-nucleotidase [Idiomarina sp.]SFT50021.1 5'-nucleotidase [Idiomarina abyssalis]